MMLGTRTTILILCAASKLHVCGADLFGKAGKVDWSALS